MDRIAALLTTLPPTHFAPRGTDGGERSRADRGPSANGEAFDASAGRQRYRVDEAYRTHQDAHRQYAADSRETAGPRLRSVRSAELLGSMIHQMGGGVMPSAKGVYVDISI